MTGFSLIIPTYNRDAYLRKTLQSLNELIVPPNVRCEVLVIDNNCQDNTQQVVAEAADRHRLSIRRILETRQGLSYARNRGLDEAAEEMIVYLDDDILINPKWISGCMQLLQDFQVDAVVGPIYPLFEQDPPDHMHGRALDMISSGYSRRGEVPALLPQSKAHELTGCNFGVTRKMAEKLQGFNLHLGRIGDRLLAGEDWDFGIRLVAAGGRTAYHPDCSIQHVMVTKKMTKEYLRERAWESGVTARQMGTGPRSMLTSIVGQLGASRKWSQAILYKLFGHREAFNAELGARESGGYWWGNLRTASPKTHLPSPVNLKHE